MRKNLLPFCLALLALSAVICPSSLWADNIYQTLPFSQDWTNTALITADDIWTGVPGIEGYRGDNLTGATGTDPQTIVAFDGGSPVLDVNANRNDPNLFITGGVTEFDGIANPGVALQGSGTADAPFLLFHIDTTGFQNVIISYNLNDIDGSADNSIQQVALQYRIGNAGTFTNVPTGYVADASAGPSALLSTPVSATDPAWTNIPQLQFRVITTNAIGNDEWISVDDILVRGTLIPEPSSWLLAGLGFLGLVATYRRRRPSAS